MISCTAWAEAAGGLVPPQIWGDLERASPTLCSALMDQKIIIDRALVRAEQLVLEGERLIAQQNELIANLLAVGLDVSAFRDTLVRLEQAQSLRVQTASKLRRDLLNASPTETSGRRSEPYELASASLRMTSL